MSLVNLSFVGLVAASVCGVVALTELPAQSKEWTVEQRQAKLMQDINAGQKSGALTAQQSKKLRKNLSNVARKKALMKEKGNGKLTAANTSELQSRIDKTSSKIKLEKGQ